MHRTPAKRLAVLMMVLSAAALALLPVSSLAGTRSTSEGEASWYFAEGTTAYGFEEYICVQNPTQFAATVQATYMLPPGKAQIVGRKFVLQPYSRATINVADVTPATDVSVRVDANRQVVCERSMCTGADASKGTIPLESRHRAKNGTSQKAAPSMALRNTSCCKTRAPRTRQ